MISTPSNSTRTALMRCSPFRSPNNGPAGVVRISGSAKKSCDGGRDRHDRKGPGKNWTGSPNKHAGQRANRRKHRTMQTLAHLQRDRDQPQAFGQQPLGGHLDGRHMRGQYLGKRVSHGRSMAIAIQIITPTALLLLTDGRSELVERMLIIITPKTACQIGFELMMSRRSGQGSKDK